MSQNKSILLIYTGGTIGMIKGGDGSLKPFDFEKLTSEIPELKKFDVELSAIAFKKPIDSSNMNPKTWVYLANLIGQHYQQYDGFVILHGSDTMAYTASALSFLLEDLCKPVILTGSQLPIGIRRTDAKENLITAIEIAASGNTPEVCVYFEYKLLRGNRTVKVNAEHFEAFDSPNFHALAEAGVHIKYHQKVSCIIEKPLKVYEQMSSSVALLKLYPGIPQEVVKAVLNSNCKGIVLETFGSGNASTQIKFLSVLESAIYNGKIILNISQCLAGAVSQGLYETSSQLEKIGVISGKDMTTEAALTKMMFLLAQDLPTEELKTQLTHSLRGELS
ncbi:MAG: L-asparaginase 1 [Flavobacteriales bacterium]|nr:L-asparaginase 1 [Flavobacteriales bacterium]|tara:strand:+ start:408 stop:1409 length:1002 start_codon:yes stop_codon:yes gene_type:complete